MGTSTAGGELHSDKLAKLQARKKELEALLAAKNEELYKLCVQEVKLTGVMPPEVPAEPAATEGGAEAANEKHGEKRESDITFRKDPGEIPQSRRSRQSHRQCTDKGKELACASRKQISHRLSTPSISGMSIKSAPTRRTDLASGSCSTLPHDNRDSFSLHSSQTYPSLRMEAQQDKGAAPAPAVPREEGYSRQHTLSTHAELASKLYYSSQLPDTQSFSRAHETHFSSSHPDITSRYSHTTLGSQAVAPGSTAAPLLYQYAAQLKARSSHLSAVQQQRPRRNTLHRTKTYHLTAHSDHPPPHEALAALTINPTPVQHSYQCQVPASSPLSPHSQHFSTSIGSNPSIFSGQYPDMQDQKVKEKEWYESSLDSPSSSGGMNLSKESIQYHSPKKTVHRSPSVAKSISHASLIDSSPLTAPDYPPPVPAPMIQPSNLPLSPLANVQHSPLSVGHSPHTATSPTCVPLESPKNCTVVELGKCIPYREVSKPFEMADFYKYSTKFRQNNNNNTQKAKMTSSPGGNPGSYPNMMPLPEDARYSQQEQWRHAHPL